MALFLEDAKLEFNLPEWYRVERESEKTIQSLRDIRELEFYAENPDPFIRRLAIIRAGGLGSRDAFSMLNKVVEDPLECEWNRALARAYMQKINESLNLGYYMMNHHAQSSYGEVSDPSAPFLPVIDSQPAIRYEFSKSLIESQLQMDQSFLKINLDNREFSFPFRFGSWLARLGCAFLKRTIGCMKKVAGSAWTILSSMGSAFFIGIPRRLAKAINESRAALNARREEEKQSKGRKGGDAAEPISERIRAEAEAAGTLAEGHMLEVTVCKEPRYRRVAPVRYKRTKTYRMPLFWGGGMLARQLLLLLCSPFRFIFRHKAVTLGTLLAIYLFVSLTVPGKALLTSLSPRLYEDNACFIQGMGQYAAKALEGKLFSKAPVSDDVIAAVPVRTACRYSVTAPKGLYLRDKPSYDSEKIVLMNMSAIVEYLDEKTVIQEVVWMKIRLDDGTSGWANAEWLKEVSDG